MTTRERILQFIEYKRISKNKFYVITGLSNGYLDKNVNVGVDKIELIYSKYPEINLYWLILGEGPMLKDGSEKINTVAEGKTFYEKENQLIEALKDTIAILKKDVEELRIDNMFLKNLIDRTYNQ